MTLIQTKKSQDSHYTSSRKEFWSGLIEWIKTVLIEENIRLDQMI
jgi:predicted Rossmann-fold nucleotide-binding protein